MEFILEIIFQFLGEILLQLLFEFFAELGVHSLADTFRKPKSVVLSTIGFVFWGAIAGVISLFIFPKSLIASLALRQLNLLVTPLVAGGVMMLIGRQRDRKGHRLVGLDRFGYAFAFALAMALVRYCFAE